MKRFFLGAAAFAAAVSVCLAIGSTAHCSWIAPTTYGDGSAIAAGDIDHYTVTWAPAATSAGPSGSLNVPGGTLATAVNVPCGSTSFTISVTTSATAKYPNATSSPSGPVPYASGIACTPNPPGGLAVQ